MDCYKYGRGVGGAVIALRCCLLVCALLFSVGLASAAITPSATASRCTATEEVCPAPLAIFFSARGTTCTTSECDDDPFDNEAFHALSYKWGFGDPEAGNWAVSGKDG